MNALLLTPVPITKDNLDIVIDAGWIKKRRSLPGREARHRQGLRLNVLARFLKSTELDTRMLGMAFALVLIWIAFHMLSGGLFLTPRNLWNLSVQSVVGCHHGDRHGARHRHPQHRSVGRLDARLRRHGHGRDPGRRAAEISRLRASGNLDRRAGERGWCSASLLGALQGCADRLSRHSVLHRHARRPSGLARRGLVGDARADRGAARWHLQAHGRRTRRIDRRDLELGARPRRLRRGRCALGLWPSPAQTV